MQNSTARTLTSWSSLWWLISQHKATSFQVKLLHEGNLSAHAVFLVGWCIYRAFEILSIWDDGVQRLQPYIKIRQSTPGPESPGSWNSGHPSFSTSKRISPRILGTQDTCRSVMSHGTGLFDDGRDRRASQGSFWPTCYAFNEDGVWIHIVIRPCPRESLKWNENIKLTFCKRLVMAKTSSENGAVERGWEAE